MKNYFCSVWSRWIFSALLFTVPAPLLHGQASGGGGGTNCCGPNAGPQVIQWLQLPTNSALLQNPIGSNASQTWIITNLPCYGRVLILQDAPTNLEVLLNRSNFYASHGIPVFDNVPNTNGNFYFTDAGYGPYRWGVTPGTVDLGYDFPTIIGSHLAPLPVYNVSFYFLDGQPDICQLILAEIGIAAKTSNTLSQPFFFRTEYDLIYAVSNYPHGPSAETLVNNTYGYPLSLDFAGTQIGSAWAYTGGDDYNTGWTLFQATNTLQTALLPPGSGTDINGNPYPPFGTSGPPYPYITVTVDGQEIGDHFSLTLGYTCCSNSTTNCLQIACPPDKEVACGSGWTFDSPTASCCCPNVFVNPATGLATNLMIQSLGLITNGVCPLQTVTENWLIIDGCGETNMCSQTVTITNCCTNTCINLQCPSNIVIATCSNCATATYSASATDPCCQGSAGGGSVTITYNPPSGSCFPEGTNTVQVTATDTCGNGATCSFTVVVVPSANCCTNMVNSLVLNTGYDPNSNSVYGFGQADATWWVTMDPTSPPTTVPRPATVIAPNVAWAAPLANSEWISSYATDSDNLNGEYDFQTYFCTATNAANLVLNVCLRADDAAAVALNGNIIPLSPANTAFNTPNPACGVAVNPSWFVVGGQNVVTLYVTNSYGVAMGVDAEISVSGSGIIPLGSPCCPFGSGLSGQKFFDLNCDGIQEPGEPGLSGWPIQLSNGSNTVTDVNGYYYFTNLAPGTYTVTEVQQAGWTQTAPSNGSYTVTLTNLQQINNLNFGNCIAGSTNCLQVQCPSNKTVACGSLWTFDTPTATTCCTNLIDTPAGGETNLIITSTGITTNGACPQLLITETWLITDACGDSEQCSQTVIVTNCCSNMPCFQVTCPTNKSVNCGATWSFDLPTATTCCTNLFVNSTGLATNLLVTPLGAVTNGACPQTVTETWSIMDACGDATNCSQTVTIVDNQPPLLTCPSNILIAVTNCNTNVTVCYSPVAVDPCSGSNLVVTCAPPSCSGFAPGTTTVTCVATNCNGLTSSCTFTVTVECCTNLTCCGPNLGPQTINWLELPTNGPVLIPGSYSYNPPGSWIVTNLPCYGRVLMTQTFPDLLSWFINTNTTNVPNIYGAFNYTETNYGPYSWNTSSGMLNLYASNQDNYTVNFYFLDGPPNPCSVVLGIDGLAQPTYVDLSQPFTFRTEYDLTNNPNGPPSAHTTLNGAYDNALIPGVTGTNVGSAEGLDFWGDYRNTGWAVLQPATTLTTTNLPAASLGGYSGPLTNLPFISLNVSQMPGDGIGFTVGYICCTNCSTNRTTCLNVQCPVNKTYKCGQQWSFDTPTATSCCTNMISGTTTNVLIIAGSIVTNSNCPPLVVTETWTILDGCNDVTNCSQTITVFGCCDCLTVNCPTNKTVQCGSIWSFDTPIATTCCTNLIQTTSGTLTNVLIQSTGFVTNGACPQVTVTENWVITDGCGDSTNCSQTVTVLGCCTNTGCCGPYVGAETINWLQFPSTNEPSLLADPSGLNTNGTWLITNLPCYGNVLVTQTFPDNSPDITYWFLNTNFVNVPAPYGSFQDVQANYGPYNWGTFGSLLDFYDGHSSNIGYTVNFYFLDGAPNPCTLYLAVVGLASQTTATVSQPVTFRAEYDLQANAPGGNGYASANTMLNGLYGAAVPGTTGTVVGSAFSSNSVGDPVNTGWAILQPASAVNLSTLPPGSGTDLNGDSYPPTNAYPCLSLTVSQQPGDGIGFTIGYVCCTNVVTNCLQVTCPTNKTVQCGTTWSFDTPMATTCCTNLIDTTNGALTNILIASAGIVTNGVCPKFITQTWSISDGCGDTTNCSQTVTVVDTTPPVINCPTNAWIVSLNSNCQLVIPTISVTATDNCTPVCSLIYTQSPTNGTIVSGTSAYVTVTVTDLCGNSNSCRVLVQGVYKKGLVVTWPRSLTTSNCLVPCVSNLLSITDCNCKPTDIQVTQSPPCDSPVGPGITSITVTVTDCNGAVASKVIPLIVTGTESFLSALTNTGINTNGALLPNHAIDPHYFLGPVPTPPPNGYTAPNALVENTLWPWLELPTYASQWIAPATLAPPNYYLNVCPPGDYTYTNQFMLPAGASPATASITGRWAADDGAVALYLNGAPTGNNIPILGGWNHWSSFTINGNFVSGLNTLLFVVTNAAKYGQSPTGLRVEYLTASVCSTCVPPSIVWMTAPQSLQAGSTATFDVNAAGTPPLTYQWSVNNAPIPGATASTLQIHAITYASAGLYSVTVTGPCGAVIGQTRLTVTKPLSWTNAWWNVQSVTNVLAATYGPDLVLAGSGNTNYAFGVGATEDFGLPNPGGQIVNVLAVNGQDGAVIEIPPLGGVSGSYTLIMDLYEPDTSLGTPSTLFASDYVTNLSSGGQDGVSLTLDSSNYLHISGTMGGVPFDNASSMPMAVDTWNRLALVVNNPQNGDNVTAAGYINGLNVMTNINVCTCCVLTNFYLNWNNVTPVVLTPPTNSGAVNAELYVSSIQFHAIAMPPQMIAGIGSPDSGPAPINPTSVGASPFLTATLSNGVVNISWPGSPYVLQETTDLSSGVWVASALPFTESLVNGDIVTAAAAKPPKQGPAKFYRLVFSP